MKQPQVIQELVQQIVNLVHPQQVILFGSAARGEMKPDSDLDLIVVMPDGTHRRHTAQKIYRSVKGIRQPFDVIVATPADLEKHKDNIGFIYCTALQEGIFLYRE